MRCGIAASGTSRRFSRPSLMSAVRSGASSATRRADLLAWPGSSMAVSPPARAAPSGSRGRKREAHHLALPVAAARHDRAARRGRSRTRPAAPRGAVRVAEIVEPVDHLRRRETLAAPNDERPREDARIGALEFAVHAARRSSART